MKKILIILLMLIAIPFFSISILAATENINYEYNIYDNYGFNLDTGIFEYNEAFYVTNRIELKNNTLNFTSLDFDFLILFDKWNQYKGYYNTENNIYTEPDTYIGLIDSYSIILSDDIEKVAFQSAKTTPEGYDYLAMPIDDLNGYSINEIFSDRFIFDEIVTSDYLSVGDSLILNDDDFLEIEISPSGLYTGSTKAESLKYETDGNLYSILDYFFISFKYELTYTSNSNGNTEFIELYFSGVRADAVTSSYTLYLTSPLEPTGITGVGQTYSFRGVFDDTNYNAIGYMDFYTRYINDSSNTYINRVKIYKNESIFIDLASYGITADYETINGYYETFLGSGGGSAMFVDFYTLLDFESVIPYYDRVEVVDSTPEDADGYIDRFLDNLNMNDNEGKVLISSIIIIIIVVAMAIMGAKFPILLFVTISLLVVFSFIGWLPLWLNILIALLLLLLMVLKLKGGSGGAGDDE